MVTFTGEDRNPHSLLTVITLNDRVTNVEIRRRTKLDDTIEQKMVMVLLEILQDQMMKGRLGR